MRAATAARAKSQPDQHALQQPGCQHADECGCGNGELGSVEAPQVIQFVDPEEPGHGNQHDRRQHGLRQIAQRPREEQHHDADQQRSDQP